MVRSALVRPGDGEHPVLQKPAIPGQNVAIFNELSKAVTMAVEPWLRRALRREVLSDASGLRFSPLPDKAQGQQPALSWLTALTGDRNEVVLLRMAKPYSEYFVPNDEAETIAALHVLISGWSELWFATVAELLGWQINIKTTAILDSMPEYWTYLPWSKEKVTASLSFGWTFADGGVVLLEGWMPVGFVQQIVGDLVKRTPGGVQDGRNLRSNVVRTYRQDSSGPASHTPVLPVRFAPLEETADAYPDVGIELLQDVYLDVAAVLAKTEMKIGQILELKVGDIVELGKMVGEPMELSLNDHNIARGEVLVLDDQLGIRISEVIDVAHRLEKANDD